MPATISSSSELGEHGRPLDSGERILRPGDQKFVTVVSTKGIFLRFECWC